MADRPEQLPEWATEDQVDDVSGQNNVVEPPAERKESGWDRREIPPRQWQNWLARLYYRWIEWARDILDDATHDETPETLAKRDSDGRMRAEDPEAAQDVATKKWTEDQLAGPDDLPVFFIRAWANFDGEDYDSDGIIQNIRGSGNISQIERTDKGLYTVTFSTPMPDGNYSVVPNTVNNASGSLDRADAISAYDLQAGSFKLDAWHNDDDRNDMPYIYFQVVR